jgi:hypothetical protein
LGSLARAHCTSTLNTYFFELNTTHLSAGRGVDAVAWDGNVPVARAGPPISLALDGGGVRRSVGLRMTSAWWMPRRWRPRKDAATRRNAPGRRWQPAIRRSPNGATRPTHGRAPRCEPGRAPGEVKHLSTPRSREDSLSSGERRGRSPNRPGGTACRRCQYGVGRPWWRRRQRPRWSG